MPTFQHAIGQGRASCGWGSPLFRVEDEGDGRNDVRVAHTRPIVAKALVELPSGQMLPRRRDRAGTRTWRSMGGGRSSALPAAAGGPPSNLSADSRKIGAAKRPKLHPRIGSAVSHSGLKPSALTVDSALWTGAWCVVVSLSLARLRFCVRRDHLKHERARTQ